MRTLYPIHTEPVSTSPETVTESKWHQPFSEPVRRKKGLAVALIVASVAPVFVPVSDVVTTDRWFLQWTNPVRSKPGLSTQLQQSASLLTPAFPFQTPSVDQWGQPLSRPVPLRRGPEGGATLAPFVTSAETVTADKWFNPFSEPQRKKPSVAQQQDVAFVKGEPFPENVNYAKFGYGLSEPVRIKSGLRTALQPAYTGPVFTPTATVAFTQTSTFIPYQVTILYQSIADPVRVVSETITLDKWFSPLSEPKRKKPSVAQQQDSAFVKAAPFSETITPDRWYRDLALPVKRWLRSYHAVLADYSFRSAYLVPAPYVDPPMASWSYSWSIPVRVRTSVMTASQSAETSPVLPQPNPPPAPGLYTVSGLYVIDQFTDNTVVYDYDGRVSHRTN